MLKKIEDIKKALEAEAYLSALALALTLPDICGKVAYPKLSSGERYIKWFDENITDYSLNEIADYPVFDGKKCYKLRCSFLHEGSIKKIPIDRFELCIQKPMHGVYGCSGYGIMTEFTHTGEKITTQSIKLEINQICFKICENAKAFYNSHDDESIFNDQNITIRDIDAEVNEFRKMNKEFYRDENELNIANILAGPEDKNS